VNAGSVKLTGVPRLGIDLKRLADADNLYHQHSARGVSFRASPHGFFDHVGDLDLLKPVRLA
jgi:hypothetical protein